MKRRTLVIAMFLSVFCASTHEALAWDAASHRRVASTALTLLPDEVPAFLRQGAALVADAAVEPDMMRLRQTSALRVAEAPEHYIDLELLAGHELPADRYTFIDLCQQLQRDPQKVGLAPYAVVEATQRLATALAEHRQRPEDAAVRARCLYHAGVLAHYAADLCMPLHTTVHHDGRVSGDNLRSPRSGIHLKVDALPGKLGDEVWQTVPPMPQPLPDVWAMVREELAISHALVDKVYELEPQLPPLADPIADEAVRTFATQRMHAATHLVARLTLYAWRESENLTLPKWSEP